MKEHELTYILGAGASFQSIPVVKTFSNRFKEFLDWIDIGIIKKDFPADQKLKFGILHKLGEDLYQSFKSHQSFDTYFKKLFHTGQNNKISQEKKVLNLYFIWEHLSKPTAKPDKHDENTFWKQSSIDKRYDALIAGLLKPLANKKEPYCKINFITWNYDLNLLMSLKNYFYPNGELGGFLDQIRRVNGTWVIEDKITIINMNGYFYSSQLANLVNMHVLTIHDIIYNKIKDENYFINSNDYGLFEGSTSYHDTDAELIKFAWENEDTATHLAKSLVENSDTIVVIGYTFPLYNRLTDLNYLDRKSITSKKIVIQNPDSNNICQNILDYYLLSDEAISSKYLKPISECNSFYIPSNIFGIKDNSGEYYFG